MSSFEEAKHQGYSTADMVKEEEEWIAEHGCLKCYNYNNGNFDSNRCSFCDLRSHQK